MRTKFSYINLLIFIFFNLTLASFMYEVPFCSDPDIPRITKKLCQDVGGVELFRNPTSGKVLCWKDTLDNFRFTYFVVDKDWNRIVFAQLKTNDTLPIDTIKEFGGYGQENGKFDLPLSIDVDRNGKIFVADFMNERVVQLQYDFNANSINFVRNIVTVKSNYLFGSFSLLPFDVSIDDNETPSNFNDDYLWVCSPPNIFKLFINDSSIAAKYTDEEFGPQAKFFYPYAIVKGQTNGVNNNMVYVADISPESVCQRVVILKDSAGQLNWFKSVNFTNAKLHSISTDYFGDVYLSDVENSKIIKATPNLENLQYFGSQGTGENQFNHLKYFSVARGSSQGFSTEDWADSSGIRTYNLYYTLDSIKLSQDTFDASIDSVQIKFFLSNPANITIRIKDLTTYNDIRTLVNHISYGTGEHYYYWDGRDSTGKLVLPGSYKITVDAWGDSILVWYKGKSAEVIVKGTRISDDVAGTWDTIGSPYVLTGDIDIHSNYTLNIQPGVYVMPTESCQIEVFGAFRACGTSENPILFTPHRKIKPVPDSTYPGFWKNIKVNVGADTFVLDNCIVEYGGCFSTAYDSAMIDVASGKTRITNSKIRYSAAKHGIYFDYDCKYPIILNDTFAYNSYYPLTTWASKVPEIVNNNTFIDNGIKGIKVRGEDIHENAFWKRCDSVWYYDITSSIDVHKDGGTAILQIDSGVSLRFWKSADLDIGLTTQLGKLIANGSVTKPIIFTGLDTIYSDNYWDGICFDDGDAGSSLKNCIVSYSKNYNLWIQTNYCVNIDSSIIRKSEKSGIRTISNQGRITNNQLSENKEFGIDISVEAETPYISGNTFSENESLPINKSDPDSVHQIVNNNTFVNTINPGIRVEGGNITKDAHWICPESGWTYFVNGNIDVYKEYGRAVLTIQAGTTLKFDDGIRINFGSVDEDKKGGLKAIGGPGPNKITFTSQDPAEYWGGIYFHDGTIDTASIMKYCIIDRGGKAVLSDAGIKIVDCSLAIERCEIKNTKNHPDCNGIYVRNGKPSIKECYIINNGYGIHAHSSNTTPYVYKSMIKDNNQGVYCEYDATPFIHFCNIESNDSCGVDNIDQDVTVDATHNWWGDSTGPRHHNGALGDSVSDYVTYNPYSTSPYQIVPAFDVSAESIISPKGRIYPDSLVQPKGVVKNNFDEPLSFSVTMKIGNLYTNSQTINVSANNSYAVTFDTCSLVKGTYQILFYSNLAGDEITSNDTIIDTVEVRFPYDIAADKIIAPTGSVDIDSLITPIGVVKNNYDSTLNFQATMKIGNFYYDQQQLQVNGLSVDTIEFSSDYLNAGIHNVTFHVHLDEDENISNDSLIGSVTVLASNYWKSRPAPPVSIARLSAKHNAGYVFAAGRDTSIIARFNIAQNSWDDTISSLLENHKGADAEDKYLYLLGYALPTDGGSKFLSLKDIQEKKISEVSANINNLQKVKTIGKDNQGEPVIYSYNTTNDSWAIPTQPLPVPSVGNGSGIIVTDTMKIYLIEGEGTKNIYWYDVSSSLWQPGEQAPKTIDYWGSFDWDRSTWIFALSSDGYLLKYNKNEDDWSSILPPTGIGNGRALACDFNNKKLYAVFLTQTPDYRFFEYDLIQESWVERASPDIGTDEYIALTYENNHIYAISEKGKFLEYIPPKKRDVAAIEILSPVGSPTTEDYIEPSGIIVNNFDSSLSVTVKMKIGNFYSGEKNVQLGPLATDTVTFDETYLEAGHQDVEFYTILTGDLNPNNDTIRDSIYVRKSDYWETLANPPFSKGKLAWDHCGNIYASNLLEPGLWKYDIILNSWDSVSTSQFERGNIGMSLVGTKIYLMGYVEQSKLLDSESERQNQKDNLSDCANANNSSDFQTTVPEIYSYDITGDSWHFIDSTLPVNEIGAGSALIATDSDNLYLIEGQKSRRLYNYCISQNQWYEKDSTYYLINYEAASCYDESKMIYSISKKDGPSIPNSFQRFIVSEDTWEKLTYAENEGIDSGCALTCDTFRKCLYCFTGNAKIFLEYNIVNEEWIERKSVANTVKYGSALAYQGKIDTNNQMLANGHVFALNGDGFFWLYTPSLITKDYQPEDEGLMSKTTKLPTTFAMFPNTPNPFVKTTTIKWQIPIKTKVNFRIYDATGRVIKAVVNEEKEPGYYVTNWNGKDSKGKIMPTGIYFCDFRADKFHKNMKIVLMK